jgi:hypothetical protein
MCSAVRFPEVVKVQNVLSAAGLLGSVSLVGITARYALQTQQMVREMRAGRLAGVRPDVRLDPKIWPAYRPDFLVRLKNGDMLVLETKGQETEKDRAKTRYLEDWIHAVNAHGGFGRWRWAVAHYPGEIQDVLMQSQEVQAEG